MSEPVEVFENASPVKSNGFSRPDAKKPKPVADRLPPHSPECEQGILSCILQLPSCLSDAIERLKSDASVFYELRHQLLYSELLRMSDDKVPLDLISLQQRLKDRGELEQIGGISYLNSIQDVAPSPANLSYYCEIVLDESVRRRVIASCTEIVQKAYAAASTTALSADLEKALEFRNTHQVVNVLDGKSAGVAMINDLERRLELNGKLSGLDTGLIDLNYMTEGIQFGEQFIVGARPSQGKTALGLTIYKHCVFNGIPSLFISLEMSVEALMRRMLSMHMEIPLRTIRKGTYHDSDFGKFISFQSTCKKHPMHIVDGVSGMGIREVCSIVRRKVVEFGIKFVVVDYLQKVKPAERHEKKTYEIGDVSGRLKALAVECGVGMMTLAQLNRENTKDKGRAPRLSDLADSGQIERDADTVGLLHRGKDGPILMIAKQRDGATGQINLVFDTDFVRFENMAREQD